MAQRYTINVDIFDVAPVRRLLHAASHWADERMRRREFEGGRTVGTGNDFLTAGTRDAFASGAAAEERCAIDLEQATNALVEAFTSDPNVIQDAPTLLEALCQLDAELQGETRGEVWGTRVLALIREFGGTP